MFGVSMTSSEITLEAVSAISAVPADEWNACANPATDSSGASKAPYNPFVSHAFFAAAEASGSATPRTGWGARHLIAKLDDKIVGVEIPTGNPLVIDLDAQLRPTGARYLDASRAEALPQVG